MKVRGGLLLGLLIVQYVSVQLVTGGLSEARTIYNFSKYAQVALMSWLVFERTDIQRFFARER